MFLLLWLASLIFSSVPAPAVGAAELKAELVNTTKEGIFAAFPTGQVQLTYPDGRTKLLKYRSHLQPVVADGKVYIFTTKDAKVTGIVVYDAASGQGQSFPLPDDLKLNFNLSYFGTFGQPGFSPDGTKVAYYFVDGESKHKPKFGFVDLTGKVSGTASVRLGRGFFGRDGARGGGRIWETQMGLH